MNEAIYIDFESYLSGEMPADAKKHFEERLQNDADFSEKFSLYKETTQLLNVKFSSEALAFRQNLKAISEDHFSQNDKKTKVIHLKPWYYTVAASVAIIFGALLFMQNDPQYSDYNQHENAYFVERGMADENLREAQNAFNSKDYKKAAECFDKVLVLGTEEEYFYAIALIETGHYAKAETLLSGIRQGQSAYKDKATWYLALSNLKQQKTSECKTFLVQIPPEAEDYKKAQELLDDLN